MDKQLENLATHSAEELSKALALRKRRDWAARQEARNMRLDQLSRLVASRESVNFLAPVHTCSKLKGSTSDRTSDQFGNGELCNCVRCYLLCLQNHEAYKVDDVELIIELREIMDAEPA